MINKKNKSVFLILLISVFIGLVAGFRPSDEGKMDTKPRVIISTDIGGTDDDDFQSMIHFLMYSDRFNTEGLISSPSYGNGKKKDIQDMIDLYAKDCPKLNAHADFPEPDSLRAVCKQGAFGNAPYTGWRSATEGSEWIIQCARKKASQPLWILVWGGLDDVAQALHDAPDIKNKIRVYWIGGPNKKWSVNSYAYIVKNFPDLWFIENNATYRGLFANISPVDEATANQYYDQHIHGSGSMGKRFENYYKGVIKMGDTPSLLYAMESELENPEKESWGGSFSKIDHSTRRIVNRNTTSNDSVPVYSIIEWHFKGPVITFPDDSSCFALEILGQQWPGYYVGKGNYVARYSPKKSETCTYKTTSKIPGFAVQSGQFVVTNHWPGKRSPDDYPLGTTWYSDRQEADLFLGDQQGGRTIYKWRQKFQDDWARRWAWLQ